MYFRQMSPPPESLIKNGHANFGTFSGAISRLDIRGMRAPFGGVPLPVFISNFRIKSFLTFTFNVGQYLGTISFFDAKFFGLAEIDLWNKENGRKYCYKSIMGPRRRFIPHNIEQGFCASFNPHRYIRISWDHKRDRVSIIFNVKGDSARPSFQAALSGHFSDPCAAEITQCVPLKSRRRCSATYCVSTVLKGSLTTGKTKKNLGQTITEENSNSLLTINRAYYGYLCEGQSIYAAGTSKGQNIAFSILNTQSSTVDPESENQNILIVDGVPTPLPPVKMTHPFGINKKWIIQDTQNMVDLTFEPISQIYRDVQAFALKFLIKTIYGKFEGVLKTKDGQDIQINGFAGIAKDQFLRI
ncbi:DUF2804 family protein [Treponema pectinovorum]|uniref:DUF2804 family protein n=1 Tax=Treponema pectinovorum TaxID=164 RepID=UPI0011C9EB56|nr:DUF2804 family protein [Treponema pectinovorum]